MPHDSPADENHIWCAIPVYNNKNTLREVAKGCLAELKNVLIVDDGSTDAEVSLLCSDLDIDILKHDKNLGKGEAIKTASSYIETLGGRYMITIDADGQHDPQDIRKFIPLAGEGESTLVIGCRDFNTENVPRKSRFGRNFANFWLRVETGVYVDDCQSGFRLYPVRYLNRLNLCSSRYDFEAEVLARAVWAGLELKPITIKVYYPKKEERVSHFRPFIDNLRFSLIHSRLVGRRLLPIKHKKLVNKKNTDLSMLRHPYEFLKKLLNEHATPAGLAASAAVGVFLGTLPLLFIHTILIIYVSTRLHLNKIMAVNIQHLCMPPFIPALCIEVGYYMRNGHWLTDISSSTIFDQFSDRLIEWALGSLIVANLGAVFVGAVVFVLATTIKKWEIFGNE